MDIILLTHSLLGERVLPVVIMLMAVWLTVTWKPDGPRTLIGRAFVWLVALQFVLGFAYWIYGFTIGRTPIYLSFPFILHPILGLFAVLLAPAAVRPKSGGLFGKLGRWKPLVICMLLLGIVTASVVTALSRF